ncbi:MAG: hypothetical protein LBB18_01040 [Puniceicoccales bacterium]|nr:hypothetical protein [Puniceicoccales bacterium]
MAIKKLASKFFICSGISNDANFWATETMHNPKYPLELVQRITTVSLRTLEIVKNLPHLNM